MSNFGTLLAEWRATVTNESKTFGKPPFLLVAAVYHSATYNSLLHPIQSIKNNSDWINVMAYSFFAPGWSPNVTGPPASLYNPISPISGDSGITAWLQAGMPPKKIAFGLPFYGYALEPNRPKSAWYFCTSRRMAVLPDG
ncbi:hypothetical protein CerSpe_268670 [Prunus speciosa]